MHQDYTKICRVCLSEGSRDIFSRSLSSFSGAHSPNNFTTLACSPLERLVEKLRYVTMMKLEESDDLPKLLCDLCIVQLNVAYNFKRQAVENDTKLRQYFIENGICTNRGMVHSSPIPQVVSSGRVSANISEGGSRTTATTNRNFPVIPFVLKTEPIDVDCLSDTTTDTIIRTNNGTPLNVDNLNLLNSSSPSADTSNQYTESNSSGQQSIQTSSKTVEVSQPVTLPNDNSNCNNLTTSNTPTETVAITPKTVQLTSGNEIMSKENRVLNKPSTKRRKNEITTTVLHTTEERNSEKVDCNIKIEPDTIYCDSTKTTDSSEQKKRLNKAKQKGNFSKYACSSREVVNLKINMVDTLTTSSSSSISAIDKRKSNIDNIQNKKRFRNDKNSSITNTSSKCIREVRQNLAKKYVNSMSPKKENGEKFKSADNFVFNPCNKDHSNISGGKQLPGNSAGAKKTTKKL